MEINDIDRFGHCVVCHKNMLYERVVDGKAIQMFRPEHDHTEFLMNDGSRMRVCICKPCKENVDLAMPAIQEMVMACVKRGWQLEVNTLVADEKRIDWDFDRAEKHMEKYNSLSIECHSEDVADHIIQERKEKIKEMILVDREIKDNEVSLGISG
jgi:hypothetical protein